MSLSLVPVILAVAAEGLTYHITVDGPAGQMDTLCSDPCVVEQVAVVGTAGGGTTNTTRQLDEDRDSATRGGVDCQGDCPTGRSTAFSFSIQTRRTLREGIELRVEDGRAHFIFYDVVEAEAGPSTRKRHSEFNLDRDVIELDLYDNDVRVEIVPQGGSD